MDLNILGDVLKVAHENDIEIDGKLANIIVDEIVKKYDFSEYNEFILNLIEDLLQKNAGDR